MYSTGSNQVMAYRLGSGITHLYATKLTDEDFPLRLYGQMMEKARTFTEDKLLTYNVHISTVDA